MHWGLIKTIIILPGTVLVFIPATLLFLADGTRLAADFQSPAVFTFYIAGVLFAAGGYLSIRTVSLFMTFGEGTPAPWEPPQKLVIRGPYRYIRNPMISGVILFLLGESILFNSWLVFLWTLVFIVGNMIYFPYVEEKGLVARFGDDYREYREQVPRWIPSLKRWDQ